MREEDLAGGRKHKARLNPDGKEFGRPKKKSRGHIA